MFNTSLLHEEADKMDKQIEPIGIVSPVASMIRSAANEIESHANELQEELIEVWWDVANEGYKNENGVVIMDSGCLSHRAHAMRQLVKAGQAEVVNDYGGRNIIIKPKVEE